MVEAVANQAPTLPVVRCPKCGNVAYVLVPEGRRCEGPNGCQHVWDGQPGPPLPGTEKAAQPAAERAEWLKANRSNDRRLIRCDCSRWVAEDGAIKLSHRKECEVETPEEERTGPSGHQMRLGGHMEGYSFGSGR